MRNALVLAALALLLASASFLLRQEPQIQEPERTEAEETFLPEAAAPREEPQLTLSRGSVEQSDTLVAKLRGVPSGSVPQGTFLSQAVSFFEAGDSWLAILGVDAKREPGTYVLKVSAGEGTYAQEAVVSKRDFPVTKLALTPELEEKGYTPTNIAQNIAVVENRALNEVLGGYTSPFYANKEFLYPLEDIKIVGAYGNIRQSGSVSLQHLGADLDAETGTAVYAVNDGTVVLENEFVNYGRTLVLDHGFGIYSLYLHLDEMTVAAGEFVRRGEVIGLSGNTGYSLEPHLHFSMKVAGESVDPLRFLETVNKELEP